MTALSPRLFRNLLAILLGTALLFGCQSMRNIDLNPFDQNSSRESNPELVPISKPSSGDFDQFPVRQPPASPRDGMMPAATDNRGPMTIQTASGTIKLRPDAPQQYVVVKGDTLWDISGLFLQDPWHWPEIWQVNPQIKNPHLIYPGDVLSLVWVDGKPQIMINRQNNGLDRMSPQIRVLPLDQAIPTIPYDALASFLSKPGILTKDEIANLPYVLEIRGKHIVAGSGFTVYTRGENLIKGRRFNVMHIGDPLYDPDTRDVLGFEAHYVGTGRVQTEGDPSRFFLTESTREVLRGDRLVNQDSSPVQDFHPSAPDVVIDGQIISVLDGVSLIGQYQIVVLNRGAKHGLKNGNVLSVLQQGESIKDGYANRSLFKRAWFAPRVKLPDEQAGRLMIFRTLDNISYGLVMQAVSEIKVYDRVTNPE